MRSLYVVSSLPRGILNAEFLPHVLSHDNPELPTWGAEHSFERDTRLPVQIHGYEEQNSGSPIRLFLSSYKYGFMRRRR